MVGFAFFQDNGVEVTVFAAARLNVPYLMPFRNLTMVAEAAMRQHMLTDAENDLKLRRSKRSTKAIEAEIQACS